MALGGVSMESLLDFVDLLMGSLLFYFGHSVWIGLQSKDYGNAISTSINGFRIALCNCSINSHAFSSIQDVFQWCICNICDLHSVVDICCLSWIKAKCSESECILGVNLCSCRSAIANTNWSDNCRFHFSYYISGLVIALHDTGHWFGIGGGGE